MPAAMLSVQHATKTFGGTRAVRDVSFEIKRGELYSLIGPNGSGKTTIIKMVAGLIQPSEGDIVVGGTSVLTDPVAAKRLIGYIPDEPVIWPKMTGEEFLHFSGALYDISEETRAVRIKELLPQFNFNGIEKNYFEQYSRGNKQKFSILAALLHKPSLLLIDEPIVGLDPQSARIAEQLFTAFTHEGGAILLATHTLLVAERLSHRIGILKDGVLIADDSFSALKKRARVRTDASLEDVYLSLTR